MTEEEKKVFEIMAKYLLVSATSQVYNFKREYAVNGQRLAIEKDLKLRGELAVRKDNLDKVIAELHEIVKTLGDYLAKKNSESH